MILRYTSQEMREIWSDDRKYKYWLDIELAVLDELAQLSVVPKDDVRVIREKAYIDSFAIGSIERNTTHHDVAAFVDSIERIVGPEARWIHFGLTGSDLVDTALALQIKASWRCLEPKIDKLIESLKAHAIKYKYLVAIGRTHGMYAEPVTYGVRFLRWMEEIQRAKCNLHLACVNASVGKLSGSVGMFSHTTPDVEHMVLSSLGICPEPVASQIVARDRHASLIAAIAISGSSIENIATNIRGLQKSGIEELSEAFEDKQKGSSSMPHKKNPILSENLTGLSRILRGYALTAMENVTLWHERDISHSSAERIIFPDAFAIIDFSIARLTKIIRGLQLNEQAIAENLCKAKYTYPSQTLLTILVKAGLSRHDAYSAVQESIGVSPEEHLSGRTLIGRHLDLFEIQKAFDPQYYIQYVDTLFRRAGI